MLRCQINVYFGKKLCAGVACVRGSREQELRIKWGIKDVLIPTPKITVVSLNLKSFGMRKRETNGQRLCVWNIPPKDDGSM